MTTTDHFQKMPDYFSSINSFKEAKFTNTNPRYKNFCQTHFTVGDEEQWYTYKDNNNFSFDTSFEVKNNLFQNWNIPNLDWDKYQNITSEDVNNTFRYIFNKFKKGIYIKILDNKLRCFLPFSKANYFNEWSNFIHFDKSRFESMADFIKYCAKCQGIIIEDKKINKFVNSWYANNCLIRPEFPIGEGDSGVSNIKDMLLTLCKERKVPDIELFINRRDFPILKRDLTEPYDSIFNDTAFPLISHKFEKYCPILGMCTTKNHSEILIPTIEDWARVSSVDGKYFDPPREFNYDFSTRWEDKKNIAVFRGTTTGEGTTIDNNPRLKLASLDGKIKNLDAGITKWNTRCRKEFGQKFLTTIEPQKLGLTLKGFLSPEEQSKYKYIINVDGHVTAYRLSLELSMGSVILLRRSKYKIWYTDNLIEFEHFVPLKEDLSDLQEKINWCIENDEKCKEIAQNALDFYNRYLTKSSILDYLQNLFYKVKNITGYYFVKNEIYTISRNEELKYINKMIFKGDEDEFKKINFDKGEVIHQNEKTKLIRYNNFILKESNDIINDCFMGLKVINPVCKLIPNFRWTYGIENNRLIFENIQGLSFSDWITKKFNTIQYLWILVQLSIIIECVQCLCLFVHRDLNTWNIIIKEVSNPIEINYPILGKGVYKIRTNIYPVIIDFGKSRGMYNDIYYGIDSITEFKPFQDLITVLLSSLYLIMNKELKSKQCETILHLANLFYKTDRIYHLKTFINNRKKYNEIAYGNTDVITNLKPLDLLNHITSNIKFNTQNWNISFEDTYNLKVKCDISLNFNEKSLVDIYNMNLCGIKKRNLMWKGTISFDNIKNIDINDLKFTNEKYIEIIKNKFYKGQLTSKKLFKIFNLLLIDKILDPEILINLRELLHKEIIYKDYLKWICDSKSIEFYGEKILKDNIEFLKN
jgi:hypothetical protein